MAPNTLRILDLSRPDQGESERCALLTELRETAHTVGFFLSMQTHCRCSVDHRDTRDGAALLSFARGCQDSMNPLFRNVCQNQLKSHLRLHPHVAQRHHAELHTT
jgi:isopenicillin N synthase-like dioxygenase